MMSSNTFSVPEAVALIVGFSLVMLVLTSRNKRQKDSINLFFVANRKVGLIIGSLSVMAAWIWAPALFVSSQKGYEQGLPGVFWFTVPNALSLVFFAFLAKRIRQVMDQGYTLPEFIRQRLGVRSHFIHIIAIFVAQTYAVIVQLTASLLLLNLLTGISKVALLLIIAALFLALAALRGIRTSILLDVIKAGVIAVVIIVIIPWTIAAAGGAAEVSQGLGGSKGTYTNLLDPTVAWAFGVPITISLLSGVVIDQQQWQRAFSIRRRRVRSAFVLGGIIFALVPASLALLGFLAANPAAGVEVTSTQLAGVAAVAHFLPKIGVVIFAIMVLVGLTSAGSAALCAVSSIGGIDIYRQYLHRKATDHQIIRASRISMFIILFIAMVISLLPNVQILYIQLLVGSFRAALLIPTVLALFWRRLSGKAAFYGMLSGIVVGVPLFIYGSLVNNTTLSSLGSLFPILVSTAICLIGSYRSRVTFDFNQLSQTYAAIAD
jgi:urea-proton symporter